MPTYFETPEPLTWEDEDSYVAAPGAPKLSSPHNPQLNHSLGEIVTALIDAGLTITAVEETPLLRLVPMARADGERLARIHPPRQLLTM